MTSAFQHPGQTEFVAERCGVSPGQCRDDAGRADAAHGSGHDPHCRLPRWPETLTQRLIEARGRATLRGLQRNFGIADPRLAVAGLNPHAGEGGSLGREEIELIMPAIEALARRRLASHRAAPGRHHVPRRRPGQLRRGAVHVP